MKTKDFLREHSACAEVAGMKDYGKTVKFTSEDLIKATGSDFIAEVNDFFWKRNAKNDKRLAGFRWIEFKDHRLKKKGGGRDE